ncbi:hypothetical protein Acr_17g0003350 [Actinidia rufa]|uniref:RNase H type-1 domain-containing protein n=1 Tax=Actinidia rufa TaxID=165716 RepID=A0A7J0G1W2_9ERIC|nr:hypothetical protein Acr_17g0003350 [Actinidia rufa]
MKALHNQKQLLLLKWKLPKNRSRKRTSPIGYYSWMALLTSTVVVQDSSYRLHQVSKCGTPIRIGFKATNNEAEYEEVLLAGLRVVVELGAQSLEIFSDSQLVVNQVQGDYLAKDARMMAYLGEVKAASAKIKEFKIRQIPREDNKKADALANLASTFEFISDRCIPLEFLASPSIGVANQILQTKKISTWMDEIIAYLQRRTLPKDKLQARRLQYRSARFCIFKGKLYKRSFSGPLLKCLRPEEAGYVLKEIHEGIYGNHSGARSSEGTIYIFAKFSALSRENFALSRHVATIVEWFSVIMLRLYSTANPASTAVLVPSSISFTSGNIPPSAAAALVQSTTPSEIISFSSRTATSCASGEEDLICSINLGIVS